jgi:hypothetical protein
MSRINETARLIMAVCQPLTGNRSTGEMLITSNGADFNLPQGAFAIPILKGQETSSLIFKADEGPNDDKSWTITNAGVAVQFISNVGGVRHNLASGTKFNFDPPIYDATIVANTPFASGTDYGNYGGLKDFNIWDLLQPDIALNLRRSTIRGFPSAIIMWIDDQPADGSTVSQTERPTRGNWKTVLYREAFQISVIISRAESAHARREEGYYTLDRITELLTDRRSVDGKSISNPSGLQILRRWREVVTLNDHQQFSVFSLLVGAEVPFTRLDERQYAPLERAVIDVEKSVDASEGGNLTLVDDMEVEFP